MFCFASANESQTKGKTKALTKKLCKKALTQRLLHKSLNKKSVSTDEAILRELGLMQVAVDTRLVSRGILGAGHESTRKTVSEAE